MEDVAPLCLPGVTDAPEWLKGPFHIIRDLKLRCIRARFRSYACIAHISARRKQTRASPLSLPRTPPPSLHSLQHGSPDSESLVIQMVWNENKNKITYIQFKIKYKIRKKKEKNNNKDLEIRGGLIVPKSAGLFLINLDHVLVLHPQLPRTHSRDRQISVRGNICLFKNYIILIFYQLPVVLTTQTMWKPVSSKAICGIKGEGSWVHVISFQTMHK